ncbi:hypothetical protein LTR97_012053 [Elasticomyces elasticus]|uniref:Uncharacterized protein n=1 Tax=Elasticomyces elasticus TaxID=574655 RepID=A0AAN7VRM1_9PEZI|nr:hypothetical protein LTR97_012053 [Elasticomyces elasticus]
MSFDSQRTGKSMSLVDFLRGDKALPSLPSPTLTNPDMVLPFDSNGPALPTPPRTVRRTPSMNYFKDRTNDLQNARTPAPKKEKRGLMSRKMLLLRSRTGSGMAVNGSQQYSPRSVPSESDLNSGPNSAYASSPTLMDVGNLAPEQVNEKRLSFGGSSFNSEEYAAIPAFLAKYEPTDGTTTDDEMFDSDSPATKKYGYSVTIEGGLDAQRRQQEEDEHNSAILSKRAEQILANAKKRLNLMEGNLRGARDLVAPLTQANLKRATSLGSSHHTYAGGSRFQLDGYGAGSSPQDQALRPLHAQASSPTMGRDYAGHARGFSETVVPERAQTALSRPNSMIRSGRIPVKASDGSWTQGLRNSRSYDSLGDSPHHLIRERPLHSRGSPDSNLEPLPEDEASHRGATSPRNSTNIEYDRNNALRIQRPPSRADDLRDQMTSLKGKISTLRDRAREDSLRRQSLQNLRTPSPFNNAVASSPEYFYTQSPSYGSPILDTNAGIGHISASTSPETPPTPPKPWGSGHVIGSSGNAFAQQAAAQRRPDASTSPQRISEFGLPRQPSPEPVAPTQYQHKRTQSGTAIVQPAANRYAHHNPVRRSEVSSAHALTGTARQSMPGAYNDDGISPLPIDKSTMPDYNYVVSEDEAESVYEDAEDESPVVVAHEDRDDAFDYKHFFLHSAMVTYGNGRSRSSSDASSVTSVETARGPTAIGDDRDFDPSSSLFPPPTPETPERLKEIERNLHKRTLSADSVSSFATFATANEGHMSPEDRSRQQSALDWPMPPSELNSGPSSRRNSRPSTAIKRHIRGKDSSSDRADSGVGLPRRSNSDHVRSRPEANIASPPMSPLAVMHDPATIAVNALLDPNGRQLGMKDKAILFGLIDHLRRTVQKLQLEDEDQYESRVLRRRLDDATKALSAEQRPSSSKN